MKLSVLFFFVLCFSFFTEGAESATPSSNSVLNKLSSDPVWHLLIGYGYDGKSDILDSTFYTDERVQRTPLSELQATLVQFRSNSHRGDAHPQCRFRGRYFWLSSKLNFKSLGIRDVVCPGFDKFSHSGNVDSLSLIFATGYLGNPASYYGHMLFKVNASDTQAIQNTAVNYGARIPDDENMLLYIGKGIWGGYESTFSAKEFYFHMHNYLDAEQRDMWEYELNLPLAEKNLLMGHVWEMLGVRHKYYFLNRNCSYRMAELLDLVVTESVNRPNRLWDAPQSILQRLSRVSVEGEPAVKAIKFIPSRQSSLFQKFVRLSKKEQYLIKDLAESKQDLNGEQFEKLSVRKKIELVDVLIEYFRFLYPTADLHASSKYKEAVSARLALPAGKVKFSAESTAKPHLGHKPSYTSVGISEKHDQSSSTLIRLRPAYYDRLDFGAGHGKNGALSMLDVSLSVSSGSIQIEELSLVSIENFGGQETGLPGDENNAWSLYAGVQQMNNTCDRCTGVFASADRGKTFRFDGEHGLFTVLAGAGYQGEGAKASSLFGAVRVTAAYRFNERFDVLVDASFRTFANGKNRTKPAKVEARYALSNDFDIRVKADYRESMNISATIGFYW